MASILNDFLDCMTQTMTVYNQTNSLDTSTGYRTKAWNLLETVNNCAFYEGSTALQLFSDKVKAETDGVIIVNPYNLTNPILDSYRLVINSRNFSVVHADNILLLDEVIAVAVKEDKNT